MVVAKILRLTKPFHWTDEKQEKYDESSGNYLSVSLFSEKTT